MGRYVPATPRCRDVACYDPYMGLLLSAGFVMVPAWLRRKKPSGNAVLVYVNLAAFGTFSPETGVYEECRPSVARLAEECGLSLSPTKRALAELYGLGAVERRACFDDEGGRAPSIYRVRFGTLVEAPGPQGDQGGGPLEDQAPEQQKPAGGPGGWAAGDPGDRPLVNQNLEPSTKKNINTGDARDPLAPSTGGVLSGYTTTVNERTDDLMSRWATWCDAEGIMIDREESRLLRREVHRMVADALTRPDTFDRALRSLAAGMAAWSRKPYPAYRLSSFVREASAPAAEPATKSRAMDRRERNLGLLSSMANMTREQANNALGWTKPGNLAIEGA
jgi:hypothetical protein